MTGIWARANTWGKSWVDGLSDGIAGRRSLAAASFLESTVVPIPLEALVAPVMVANSRRAFQVAAAIWVGSLLGAVVFYVLARLFFEPVVEPGLASLGAAEAFADVADRVDQQGVFWTVFILSIAPAPFQLATLGAGSLGANFVIFLVAVAISRGIRYFGLAVIARAIGPRVEHLLHGKSAIVIGVTAGLVAAYAVYGLIF